MVVTWSTSNVTKSSVGMISPKVSGSPPSVAVQGTIEVFVDPGTAQHTQWLHVVTFTGLKPGYEYGKEPLVYGIYLIQETL